MSYHRNCRRIFLSFAFVSALWAGREFKAGPGEEIVADELLVRFKPGAAPASVLSALAPGSQATPLGRLNLHLLKFPHGLPPGITSRLANDPSIDFVERNHIRHALVTTPSDPDYSQQWPLQNVEALSAWNVVPNAYLSAATVHEPRTKVAILDTGVDCTHPDFRNAGGTSSDSAQGGQISYALSRAFVTTTKSLPGCPWADDNGHGTHTAGTIAAATNNSQGVSALGYPLELIVFKVMDSKGSGSDATIASAITAAADAGATVISLSLGGTGYSQTLQDAVTYAWQHNSLVVAAAGNSATNTLTFPAAANHAVGVAATDSGNNPASFSNFGDYVAIAAPGVDVLSTAPTYTNPLHILNYALLSGTSMATPHVAALAGLVAMTTPTLGATALVQRIQQSASSSDPNGGWDESFGYGVIDAYNALAGNLRSSTLGSIVGQVIDSSGLPVTNAQVSAAGLSILTDSSGLFRFANTPAGHYTLTVTASAFATYNTDTVVTAGADTNVTVTMGASVGTFTGTVTAAGVPVAGAVVDALSNGLVAASAITDTNGQYSLTVPAGTYNLRASGVSKISATLASQIVPANASVVANITIDSMGMVAGVVRDPNHNPIANAQITVSGSGFSTGAITDLNGHYSTIGMPSGTYTITASAFGFQDGGAGSVSIALDTLSTADIQLGYSPTGYPVTLVNAGGPTYTDAQGRVWNADQNFSGGSTYSVSSNINGTSNPTVYKSERYGSAQYRFIVPYGSYTVNLKFAELYFTQPGQRVFNVAINGQTVLTNFDVVAAAGAGLTAVDQKFPVNVTDGQITIQLIPVVSDPTLNGIEISPITVSPANVTLTASQSRQFSAAVTGSANTTVNWSISPASGSISASGLYSAPAAVPAQQTITVTATSAVNGATTGSATVILVPPGGVRIDSGGAAYTDSQGRTWSADYGYSGGSTYSVAAAISGTTTPVLYQSERTGTFSYQLMALNGTYSVNLKFAELYFTSNGQRLFNVAINGQPVLTNFDVVASAGGGFKAVDRAFPVNVTNGQINIQFSAVLSQPTINAIEIVPQTGVGVSISPANAALGPAQSQIFSATVTGTANTAVSWSVYPATGSISSTGVYTAPASVTTAQNVTVTATSLADQVTSAYATISLVPAGSTRVNAGGGAYTDPQGRLWSADSGFTGGNTYSVNSAISGTNTAALYQSERYGAVTYQFAVLNGSYTVNLKFAELYFTTPGNRIFNVLINGQTVLANFDVVAAAGGGLTAVDRPFPINVTNGQITIQLTAVLSDPTINAIEISPVTVTPSAVALTASQSQGFSAVVTGFTNTSVTWTMSPSIGSLSSGGLYTAPASLSSNQTVTVIATSVADPNSSASATVTLLAPAVLRVNAGGPAYTDPQGRAWGADTGSNGGTAYTVSSAISGTTTPAIYQSERYGTFAYQFGVANGTYNVNLKFAELYFTTTGQRVFNVAINGQSVLTNFDVVAAAGGGLKAVDRAFSVNVTGGQITIQLSAVTSQPTINGIEITPQTGIGVTVNPTSATLAASQSQTFTATVTGNSNTAVSWSVYPPTGSISSTGVYTAPSTVTSAQNVTVTATSVADQVTSAYATVQLVPSGAIRVNTGGGAYTDPLGRVWGADNGFTGGNTYSVSSAISGTNTPVLYQSERYGALTYQFAVLNGSYTVNLKFAELYFTTPGNRMFNVLINGQTVLANFDVVAAAGAGLKAVDRPFAVNVTGGQITIQLTAVQSDPTINGIEISPLTVTPSSTTVAASGTQLFSASSSVTWSVDAGTITSAGLYTAPANIASPQTAIVTATSTTDSTLVGYATVNLIPAAIRVNAGGPGYTDPQGNVWSADNGYSGGSTYSVSSAITGTTTPAIYQTERYGNVTYQFPVTNGSHTVTLKFAELYFTTPGNRTFNVTMNGQTMLTNFDVVAAAGGGLKAVDQQFTVNVTNGSIAIQLIPVISAPTLNGIEIH